MHCLRSPSLTGWVRCAHGRTCCLSAGMRRRHPGRTRGSAGRPARRAGRRGTEASAGRNNRSAWPRPDMSSQARCSERSERESKKESAVEQESGSSQEPVVASEATGVVARFVRSGWAPWREDPENSGCRCAASDVSKAHATANESPGPRSLGPQCKRSLGSRQRQVEVALAAWRPPAAWWAHVAGRANVEGTTVAPSFATRQVPNVRAGISPLRSRASDKRTYQQDGHRSDHYGEHPLEESVCTVNHGSVVLVSRVCSSTLVRRSRAVAVAEAPEGRCSETMAGRVAMGRP
jgi:hypothetical protein